MNGQLVVPLVVAVLEDDKETVETVSREKLAAKARP